MPVAARRRPACMDARLQGCKVVKRRWEQAAEVVERRLEQAAEESTLLVIPAQAGIQWFRQAISA